MSLFLYKFAFKPPTFKLRCESEGIFWIPVVRLESEECWAAVKADFKADYLVKDSAFQLPLPELLTWTNVLRLFFEWYGKLLHPAWSIEARMLFGCNLLQLVLKCVFVIAPQHSFTILVFFVLCRWGTHVWSWLSQSCKTWPPANNSKSRTSNRCWWLRWASSILLLHHTVWKWSSLWPA